MKKLRVIALLLAASMMVLLFAGCGKTEENTGKEPHASTQAEQTGKTEASTGKQTEASAQTEKVDLQGYEFILLSGFGGKFRPNANESAVHDKWIEDYERIQAENNFVLTFVDHGTDTSDLMAWVVANEYFADFVLCRHSDFFTLSVSDYIRPLDGDLMKNAGFDVTDSGKWDQMYTKMSEFNGNTWAVITNSQYYLACFGHVLCFNEEITRQAGYDRNAMYELVRKGEWTYNKYLEIARAVTKDLNMDGTIDQWGTGAGSNTETLTNGYCPVSLVNGKWTINLSDPKYMEAVDFVMQSRRVGQTKNELTDNGDLRRAFCEGKSAFTAAYGWNFWEEPISVTDVSFGVLPYPKGPSASNYTCIVPDLDAWVMFSCNPNYEKSVKCMNAWGEVMTDDTWKDMTKTIFRDETAWDIFEEYIYPNQQLNLLSVTKPLWKALRNDFLYGVRDDAINPASVVESVNQSMQMIIDDALNK